MHGRGPQRPLQELPGPRRKRGAAVTPKGDRVREVTSSYISRGDTPLASREVTKAPPLIPT